jgi:hypothetical protein
MAAAAVFAAEKAAAERREAAGGSGGKDGGKQEQKRQRKRAERAPRPLPPGVAQLSKDDYFLKSGDFSSWLLEDRGQVGEGGGRGREECRVARGSGRRLLQGVDELTGWACRACACRDGALAKTHTPCRVVGPAPNLLVPGPSPMCWPLAPQYFNELSSEASHALFEEFVEDWNGGHVRARAAGELAEPRGRWLLWHARSAWLWAEAIAEVLGWLVLGQLVLGRRAVQRRPPATDGGLGCCWPVRSSAPLFLTRAPPPFVVGAIGRQLALKYYQGLVQAPVKRTTHQWGFGGGKGRGGGMAALMDDQRQQKQEAWAAARQAEGHERKKWRAEQKVRGEGWLGVDGAVLTPGSWERKASLFLATRSCGGRRVLVAKQTCRPMHTA